MWEFFDLSLMQNGYYFLFRLDDHTHNDNENTGTSLVANYYKT